MESFFLCNGNETQKIVSPTGGAIFDLRGSLEWSAQGNPEYSICAGHLQYVLNAIMFFEILFQIYPTIPQSDYYPF